MDIKDSGARRDFPTGSRRDVCEHKGNMALVTLGWPFALRSLGIHMMKGAQKYGRFNWLKGQPLSEFLRSAQNHLMLFGAGDISEPHIIAAAWNLLSLIETWFRIKVGLLPKELNDLPVPMVVWDDFIEDSMTFQWRDTDEDDEVSSREDDLALTLEQRARMRQQGLRVCDGCVVNAHNELMAWDDIIGLWIPFDLFDDIESFDEHSEEEIIRIAQEYDGGNRDA